MKPLELEAVTTARLTHVSTGFEAGLHVVLGAAADGASDLIAVSVGAARPRRGRVRVRGADPFSSPTTRARVLAVHASEPPIGFRATVEDALGRLSSRAGQRRPAAEALAVLGLGAWAARPVGALSAAERRSFAAAAVVSRREPVLIGVFEPFANLPGVDLSAWRQNLVERAAEGACVVVATARPGDAALFAPDATLLEHGAVTRRVAVSVPGSLPPGASTEYVVRCDEARLLAEVLSHADEVDAVSWDASARPGELRVRGRDAAELSGAILRACRDRGLRLDAMHPRREGLETLRARTAALGRIAYEATYRAGSQGARS